MLSLLMHSTSRKHTPFLLAGLCVLATVQCKRAQAPVAEPVAVTTSDLAGKSWGGTGPGARYHFEVSFTDRTAKFETNAEGTTCGLADFTLSGSIVSFSKTRACPGAEAYVVPRDLPAQECRYVVDAGALEHTITLHCPDFSLGRLDSLVAPGRKIFYDNLELTSEGWASAETVTPAKFRSKPDKSAATIAYDPGNEIEGSKPKTDVIPAGAHISLIARTPEKHHVEKWENYWYLVQVYGLENYRGWVFGELIRKKQ